MYVTQSILCGMGGGNDSSNQSDQSQATREEKEKKTHNFTLTKRMNKRREMSILILLCMSIYMLKYGEELQLLMYTYHDHIPFLYLPPYHPCPSISTIHVIHGMQQLITVRPPQLVAY